MKKITLFSVKSFIRNNKESLFINVKSDWDGMTDGLIRCNSGFVPVQFVPENQNNLGIKDAFFVKRSADYFYHFEEDGFKGIN